MEIETRNYENTNGKSPRGYGYWIFTTEDNGETFEYVGSYQEAKKRCSHRAKKRGLTKLILKP